MRKFRQLCVVALLAVCLAAIALFAAGCGKAGNFVPAPDEPGASSDSNYDIVVTDDRLIVYYVDMAVTVDDTTAVLREIRAALRQAGGWEQSSSQSGSGYAQCVMRVPTAGLDAFLSMLESSGTVNNCTVRSDDITGQYVDVNEKKEVLQKYKTMLEQQLELANTFEQQRQIMYEISEVTAQIESYDKQLSEFEQLADYSTVTLTLYGASTYKAPSYWDRLGEVFFGSTSSLGTLVGVVLQIIAALLPYALLIAAIFGIVVLIIFISCKIRKKKFDLFEKSRRNRELKRLEKQRQDQLKQQRLEVLKQKIESSANEQSKDN